MVHIVFSDVGKRGCMQHALTHSLLIDRALYNPGVDVFVFTTWYIAMETGAVIFGGDVVMIHIVCIWGFGVDLIR